MELQMHPTVSTKSFTASAKSLPAKKRNNKMGQFGDKCTEFFHSNATIRHRQNTITLLRDSNGLEFLEHEAKANLLWDSFKGRMGTSNYTHMYLDLSSLLTVHPDLDILEINFSKEEIDRIVADLTNNKSPGPDGFNGEFLKKCWTQISQDFYDLSSKFFDRQICVQSINGSYITLIQKTECPLFVGDFRPISLLNSSIKLVTKILAEGDHEANPPKSVWLYQNENNTRLPGLSL